MSKADILVVDDVALGREMLQAILEDQFTVHVASNGQEALNLIKSGAAVFRLMLLDIHMPVMDGFQVLQALRDEGIIEDLPVLVISGEIDAAAINRAYDLGALDFILKPYNPSIVRRRIANVMAYREQTYRDMVTGALNRHGLMQELRSRSARADGSRYSVCYYSLRNYAAFTDLLGIAGVSDILRHVHQEFCQSALAPELVARIDADRFVLLAKDETVTPENLRALARMQCNVKGRNLGLYGSFGVAPLSNDPNAASISVDRARMALESVVDENAEPYAFFHDDLGRTVLNHAEILGSFEGALAAGEFKVYYQPIMEVATGRLASAEALIRWEHPERGLVSPGLFVPVLEKNGYISQLDLFVARHVCEVIEDRSAAGLPCLPVSVNLSWMDLFDDSLVDELVGYVQRAGNSTGLIRFELTETSVLALEGGKESVIDRLHGIGAKVLLDDFGSGFSSFRMLVDYDFDFLKLDMSLVSKIHVNPRVRTIIAALVKGCHDEGLQVVAEGVENEAQLQFLRDCGCDYVQGYYFSKPLNRAEFVNFIESCKASDGLADSASGQPSQPDAASAPSRPNASNLADSD